MGYDQFGDGSGCCGRQLRINYNGKSTVATCVDECASCPQWGQIDLTKGLFEYFVGDLGIGVFYGSWSYVNGDDSGDGDETTTKKQTTSTTHKTTSTPKATSTTVKKAAAVTTTHTSSSAKPSSSKKASSSSKQASSSSKQASSSSKASSSAKPSASAVSSTSATSAIPTATEAVANVGSSADNTAGAPIAGAIGTGGESGAPSLGVNKLVAAVAVVALAAVQAL
ncbi:hypothetical protein B0H10DRAFT_269573 [Mycena sp. CBHHK59/15]|nr:hypothetical protein B0H10DRAFT_269573 [Mycena sp. CBHHK59/15]